MSVGIVGTEDQSVLHRIEATIPEDGRLGTEHERRKVVRQSCHGLAEHPGWSRKRGVGIRQRRHFLA